MKVRIFKTGTSERAMQQTASPGSLMKKAKAQRRMHRNWPMLGVRTRTLRSTTS